MSVISSINRNAIPTAINKEDVSYKAIIGQDPFTPNVTIVDSSDFNCGALCNEIEFLNLESAYFYNSMMIDSASGTELEDLINSFIDLPRRGTSETDDLYRTRFKAIVAQKTNYGRQTKWSIIDAISYFVDRSSISINEYPDTNPYYFEVRIIGTISFTNTMFFDYSYLDNSYLGGIGAGPIVTFIKDIINRIRPVGTTFNVYFVVPNSITTTTATRIGSVIKTYLTSSRIKNSYTLTTTTSSVIS